MDDQNPLSKNDDDSDDDDENDDSTIAEEQEENAPRGNVDTFRRWKSARFGR